MWVFIRYLLKKYRTSGVHAEPFFFQCKQEKEEICAILPTYSYCKQITPQEFEEQKVSTSQAAVAELLENIIKDKNLSVKDKKKKLKQVSLFHLLLQCLCEGRKGSGTRAWARRGAECAEKCLCSRAFEGFMCSIIFGFKRPNSLC